jgi:hypothetical protein
MSDKEKDASLIKLFQTGIFLYHVTSDKIYYVNYGIE